MMNTDSAVIVSADIREYFQREVDAALTQQSVVVDETTAVYLVNLLAEYIRARELFEQTDDGLDIKPLAMHYADAVNAASTSEKTLALRRLGDVALFISGLFSGSLNRKLVDIDYYIAMGGNAYGYLAETLPSEERERPREVFEELSTKFVGFVDVLMEVAEQSRPACHSDILRLYELWQKTGSRRAEGQLRNLGLTPGNFSNVKH